MISRLQTDSNQKQLTRTEEKVSKTIKETATTSIYELKEKHEARVFCLGHLATTCKKIDHLVCGGALSFQNVPNAFQIFYFNRRNFGWGVGVKREKKGLVFGVLHPDSKG